MLSERIRFLRKAAGLTLEQLGDEIGMKKGSLSDVENGKKSVSIEMLIRIADYFDVSTDYLLGRSNDPTIHMPTKKDASQ